MMAGDLQAGFTNNVNIVQTRTSGTSMQRSTDRAIDLDGDGSVEVVTLTHVSGHAGAVGGGKIRKTVTTPDGIARSTIVRGVEQDGGVNVTGSEFTEGSS
jgi:hypothetical protein